MKKEIKGRTITMRIEDSLIEEFKNVCKPSTYQDKIRQLMKQYIEEMKSERARRTIKDKSINMDFLTKG